MRNRLLTTFLAAGLAASFAVRNADAAAVAPDRPRTFSVFSLKPDHTGTLLNGRPFLVVGLRLSNGLISDAKTDELIGRLDEFARYGVNTISVFLQGSRFGDVRGYRADATLDPVLAGRLGRIIEAADARGMVVLVGCLYHGDSRGWWRHWTQADAERAVAHTIGWLQKNKYRNVFVDVNNEHMAPFDDSKLIAAAKAVDSSYVVGTSGKVTPPNADLSLHHGSPNIAGKYYIETEGTGGDYWGAYSKQPGRYNYIHIGVYTDAMKREMLRRTDAFLDRGQGYLFASTWLQCVPPDGPNHTPGGMGTPDDPGVRWWLEHVRSRVGSYRPAAGSASFALEGMRLWLDASDPSTLELQGEEILRWRDKSGAGNHATAAGAPRLVPGAFGHRPAVRFSGKDSFALSALAGQAGPITAFVVSRRIESHAGGSSWQRLLSIRAGDTPDNQPPNLCFDTGRDSAAYPACVKVISKDNIAPGPAAIGAIANRASFSSAFRGDIAEVMVYDRGFLSEGALLEVMGYLAEKWGAAIDRQSGGWTRVGPLGPAPGPADPSRPLSDPRNEGGWISFPEFSDEFNGGALDEAKWERTSRWRGRPPGLFLARNVTVADGCLVLAMRGEDVPEMKNDPRYHTFTSAWTATRLYTRYGYFEVRARPMNSAGSSSFWFAGSAKPWRIEIDVFEIGGKAAGREHAYHMNAHVFRENGIDNHWNSGGVWQAPWRLADDFHVYGLAWTPQRLVFYVDGVEVRSQANTHWHMPMHLIFDSETMPDWFGLPEAADLPSFYQIDYVRAWKRPGWGGAISEQEKDATEWAPLPQ